MEYQSILVVLAVDTIQAVTLLFLKEQIHFIFQRFLSFVNDHLSITLWKIRSILPFIHEEFYKSSLPSLLPNQEQALILFLKLLARLVYRQNESINRVDV